MPEPLISDTRRRFDGADFPTPDGPAALVDTAVDDREAARVAARDRIVAKIHLTADRLLLQDERRAEGRSTGGIVMPETREVRGRLMRILAVGPDADAGQIGALVMLGTYAGTVVDLGDLAFLVVKAEDVILRLDE